MDQKKMDFLTRLEQLQFSLLKSNVGPSSQADSLRNSYLHLCEGIEPNASLEHLAYSLDADRNKEMYANVVDNMDESGLNNFAAGALSLCHYHKNESSKWQTSLTRENIVSLPCFQALDKERKPNKIEHSNLTIPIKKKRVDDSSSDLCNPLSTHSSSARMLNKSTSSRLKNPANISSASLPLQQFDNDKSRVSQSTLSHSSNFKVTHSGRNQQPETSLNENNIFKKQLETSQNENNIFKTTPSASLFRNSKAGGTEKSYRAETRESVDISTAKVGGPYANFGQKPRKGQQRWNYGKESAKCEEDDEDLDRQTPFRTAREQFIINQQKKHGNSYDRCQVTGSNYGAMKKSLGTRRGPANRFVPPVLGQDPNEDEGSVPQSANRQSQNPSRSYCEMEEPVDERLKGIDPNMIELIKNDIMDQGSPITWTDIAGLEFAKKTIQEIVVWPMLRPDIFTGLRGPPKGLLLFGPPGTGKTLIGKCIASQSKSTFFCISASSLTSKWVGEGEKMVRALFAVARCSQPAVVFIDEVDSLLSQRSDSEHESSRRIKTEFLVQLDGASTASDERLLVIGATNRPQEIDEAARRRFVKRLLIPLPEKVARKQIIVNLMSQQKCDLSEYDLNYICDKTDGYSGADMSNLCREAALGPIRSIPFDQMETITSDQVRPMLLKDFEQALLQVRASVSSKDLELYVDWNKTYGSFGL